MRFVIDVITGTVSGAKVYKMYYPTNLTYKIHIEPGQWADK